MRGKNKKSIFNKYIGLIILALFFGLLVLKCLSVFVFSPFFYYHSLKKELNNEILDQNYAHWTQVDIEDGLRVKLPESWVFQKFHDTSILIADDSGAVIAVGVNAEAHPDISSFISKYYGSEVVSYHSEAMGPAYSKNGAEAYTLSAQFEDSNKREQIILILPSSSYQFCFFSTDYDDEILAIIWSL